MGVAVKKKFPLSDLLQSGATVGQVPKWNGTAWVADNEAGGGGGTWGSITGTLSNQTDLQAALDAKASSAHTHALGDLTQSGATTNQVIQWNGSAWVPANAPGGVWGTLTGTLSNQTDLQNALDAKFTTPNSWAVTTDFDGISSIVSVNLADQGGIGVNAQRKQINLNLTEDVTDSIYGSSFFAEVSGNFDLYQFFRRSDQVDKVGTELLEYLYYQNTSFNVNEGSINQLRAYETTVNLGNGTDASSSNFSSVFTSSTNIKNNHTASQVFHSHGYVLVESGAVINTVDHTYGQVQVQEDLNGINLIAYHANIEAGNTVNFMNGVYSNPSIEGTLSSFNFVTMNGYGGGDIGNLIAFSAFPGVTGGIENYYGMSLGMNGGAFTNFYGMNVSWGSAIDCNSFHGLLITPNIGTLDNYMAGLKFQPNGTNIKACDGVWASTAGLTPYPGVKSSVTIQDLFYEAIEANSGFDALAIIYTGGGTAGAEMVTAVFPNITVQIEDGVSTAQNVKDALDANGTFTSIATVTITGTASNPQTVQGPTNLAGGENVGQLRAAYFQGDVQIDGALQFSGALSVGQLNGAFFQNLANGAGNPVSVHSLISGFTAEASTSYTLADAIGVNTASVMNFNANSSVTTALVGISATVLPAVVQTHTGCSVDRVAGATFAISLDGSSTGGTLDIVSLCRSVAVPNGITTLSRLYGYEFDLPFGDPGTDTWGVYATPDVPSWFKGSILVGGSAGSGNDRPTNASCGIEIVSTTKAFRASNMTSTERDALTALDGMIIYNTTTAKLQVYAGGWVDLH